jgi:hypothetical protein
VLSILLYTPTHQLEFVSSFKRGKLNETRRDRDFFFRLLEYGYQKINLVPEDTTTLMPTKAHWTLEQYIKLTDILFNDNNLNVSVSVCVLQCCFVHVCTALYRTMIS